MPKNMENINNRDEDSDTKDYGLEDFSKPTDEGINLEGERPTETLTEEERGREDEKAEQEAREKLLEEFEKEIRTEEGEKEFRELNAEEVEAAHKDEIRKKVAEAVEKNLNRIEEALTFSKNILETIIQVSEEAINASKTKFSSTVAIKKIKGLAEEKLKNRNALIGSGNLISEEEMETKTQELSEASEKLLEESIKLEKELKKYTFEEKWISRLDKAVELSSRVLYKGGEMAGKGVKWGAEKALSATKEGGRLGVEAGYAGGRAIKWGAEKTAPIGAVGLKAGLLGAKGALVGTAAAAVGLGSIAVQTPFRAIRGGWRAAKFLVKSIWSSLSNVESLEDLSRSPKGDFFNKLKEAWRAMSPEKKEKKGSNK